MLRWVWPILAGFAVCLGVRLTTVHPPGDAPNVDVRARPVEEGPPAPRITPQKAAGPAAPCPPLTRALEQELTATTDRLHELRELGSALGGEKIPWPEDVPDAYREDALASAVAHAVDSSDFDLVLRDLVCDEYPCIAVVEVIDERQAPPGTSESRFGVALVDGLRQAQVLSDAVVPQQGWRGGPDHNHMIAIGIAPEALSGDETFRLRQRIADIEYAP